MRNAAGNVKMSFEEFLLEGNECEVVKSFPSGSFGEEGSEMSFLRKS